MSTAQNRLGSPRTLSRREAELVSWLEFERPRTIDLDKMAEVLDVPKARTYDLASRLARKGWLHRTHAGQYEPLLGESAGIHAPNPWPALSAWKVPYYVGLASAAYEHNLTPDRPGAVQVCVRAGTTAPAGWRELGIALVARRVLELEGSEMQERHGVLVRLAGVERVLLDAARTPGRVGGVFGLARIVDRALERAEWSRFAELARRASRGGAAARRIAAVTEILGHEVPAALAALASVPSSTPLIYLASIRSNGRRGQILARWRVLVNISPEAIREEVRR
jgi:predicted transcriptional regulator of viral defense system